MCDFFSVVAFYFAFLVVFSYWFHHTAGNRSWASDFNGVVVGSCFFRGINCILCQFLFPFPLVSTREPGEEGTYFSCIGHVFTVVFQLPNEPLGFSILPSG